MLILKAGMPFPWAILPKVFFINIYIQLFPLYKERQKEIERVRTGGKGEERVKKTRNKEQVFFSIENNYKVGGGDE